VKIAAQQKPSAKVSDSGKQKGLENEQNHHTIHITLIGQTDPGLEPDSQNWFFAGPNVLLHTSFPRCLSMASRAYETSAIFFFLLGF
jgi:hypothetical protein